MRKPIAASLTLLAALVAANCTHSANGSDSEPAQSAAHYLQASSSVTQCPGTAPEVVAMDITDAASGVAMAANQMTVSEAGAYLIVAAPQVGSRRRRPLRLLRSVAARQRHRRRQLQRPALPGRGEHGQGRHHLAGHRAARGG